VFAVSLDLDGQIQVLHPAYPGISVRILQHKQLRLPNFFAGFSHRGDTYDASGRYASYSDYYGGTSYDSRGTVIALASRAPFNLERLESDGDWNISAIRRLIEHRSPVSAARALAAYLGVKGEAIGTDFMRFAPTRNLYYSSSYYPSTNGLYGCDMYDGYSPGLALSRLAVLTRVAQLQRAGQNVSIVGYDFCLMPIVIYGPSEPGTSLRPATPPRNPADTLGGKNRSPPRSGPPLGIFPRRAEIETVPITRRAEQPETGGVMIETPRPGRRDPRDKLIEPRNEAGESGVVERNGVPVERQAPRAETPMIGTEPAREYSRPIFREAPLYRPEPLQAPERSPAPPPPPPVVHEQPSSPPPPPPRPESEPRQRPVADPVPPPKQ
jgi:hypothetical protein